MSISITDGWYVASVLFFALEVFGVSGIGFLFAALGALCLGVLLQAALIEQDAFLAQGAFFLLLTGLWAGLLWKPLKQWQAKKPEKVHHNMIGRTAVVSEGGLVAGKAGNAYWSGTIMMARLAPQSDLLEAPAGTELTIVAVEGSTLILSPVELQS